MVDIIKDIEETVEKGIEEVEEIVEKVALKSVQPQGLREPASRPSSTKNKDTLKGTSKGEESLSEEGKNFVEGKIEKKSETEKLTESEIKEAEKESTEMTIEQKKKIILEKAAKLKEKFDEPKIEDLKEQIKGKKKSDPLIEIDDYVRAGIYLGTKVVTPDMKPFVYRRRADGLAIFDTNIIDEKLKEAVEFLGKFETKDIIIVCKRPAGWKVVKKFSEITGIRAFTKKYPAGILTNTDLPDFFENELTIVCDSWLDRNSLADTKIVNKKVLMICDTNNFSKGADQIIIGNNKSPKSLGIIFYLLTREYCKTKNIECEIPEMNWWITEDK